MRYVLPDVTMYTEYADFSNWWKMHGTIEL